MEKLTDRQKLFLKFLRDHHAKHGYWPSIRDIQEHFSLKSTNGVTGHLRALERKGHITRVPGAARAYRLAASPKSPAAVAANIINAGANDFSEPQEIADVIDIPVYGSIAAGYPDGVESSGAVARLQMGSDCAGVRRKDGVFALRVRGESMIDAGIHDGDTVILEKGEPHHGDIVAALIDGQTTLKRYIRKNGRVFLKAENSMFPDLFPVAELFVQGIAKSLVRKLA